MCLFKYKKPFIQSNWTEIALNKKCVILIRSPLNKVRTAIPLLGNIFQDLIASQV